MDDEIDIEEHDILEHPQVKAIFPDLSKLQIYVHTSEDAFLYSSADTEENPSFLEDRKYYVETDFADESQEVENTGYNRLSNTLYVNGDGNAKEYFDEDDCSEVKKEVLGALEIHEDCSDVALNAETGDIEDLDVEEDLIDEHEMTKNIVEIQDISDDECRNNTHSAINELNKEKEMTVMLKESHETNPSDKNGSLEMNVDDIHEISDDEEREIADVIREIKENIRIEQQSCGFKVARVNNVDHGNEMKDTRENGDEIYVEAPHNEESIIDNASKNGDEFIEDEVFKDQEFIDKEIPDQNEQTNLKYSEPYLDFTQVPIKNEIIDEIEETEPFHKNLPLDVHHNKIILGSKPSPRPPLPDRNNSYLIVLLEDWGEYIKKSQCFCDECKILFPTPNTLNAHNMTSHSLLAPITNRAVKSTAKSSKSVKNSARKSTSSVDIYGTTYCNHCNITFKDHTALIKHLYELLPVKTYTCKLCNEVFKSQSELITHNAVHIKTEPRKVLKAKKLDNPILRNLLNLKPKPVEQNENKPVKVIYPELSDDIDRYKCKLCSKVFDSYGFARKHRRSHPESPAKTFLFKRILTKIDSNYKDKLKYEDDGEGEVKTKKQHFKGIHAELRSALTKAKPFDLIPKSALFQCSFCTIHFTSCIAGRTHLSYNKCGGKNTGNCWSCPVCKKEMRSSDKLCHTKQHELSNKIKIYKITKNTSERTLCRCLKCGVYFDYILLKLHIRKCGKIPTAKCLKCNILIAKHKLVEHARKHDVSKLKPKDFILVDYVVINDKTKKNASKITKSKTVNNPVAVSDDKIEPGVMAKKTKMIKRLTSENDKIAFYHCTYCKLCLINRDKSLIKKTHLTRSCLGKYRRTSFCCKWCGLLLHRKSRAKHEAFHTERGLTLNDFQFFDYATLKPITLPIPKYPSCNKCGIHFLIRSLIKNHICGEDYENCEFCGEKFEISALEVHREFHRLQHPKEPESEMIPKLMMKYESLNPIWNILFICRSCKLVTDTYNTAVEHSQTHINRESIHTNTVRCYICNFKIDEKCWSKHTELHSRMDIERSYFKLLKYTPEHLLEESWFQMFESLPEQEIKQIIDRSVFGSERSLKMRLVKDGLPEFTIYCCSNCKVSYDSNDIISHVKNKCKFSTHICKKCDITFDSANTLNFHEQLHIKGIKIDEFRIVHFIKDNAKVMTKSKKLGKKRKVGTVKKGDIPIVLYRCEECTVCVQLHANVAYHICAPDHHRYYCNVCKQNFSSRQRTHHSESHLQKPHFTRENTKIVNFKPTRGRRGITLKTSRNTPKLCEAPASMSENESQDSELTSSKPSSTKIKSDDFESADAKPKRNTLNSSKSIVKHTETTVKTVKIYKCNCGLHFTSVKTIKKHMDECSDNSEISKEKCSKCNLLFPTDVLVSHLCMHHSQNSVISVENITKTGEITKKAVNETKLYKCSYCNVYFMNRKTCYKHVYKHKALDPKQYIECKMCLLQFMIPSLHIHIKRHHENVFELENVLIEEYHPSGGKAAPKIDIYHAKEKIQNVQVSSSND